MAAPSSAVTICVGVQLIEEKLLVGQGTPVFENGPAPEPPLIIEYGIVAESTYSVPLPSSTWLSAAAPAFWNPVVALMTGAVCGLPVNVFALLM